MGIVLALVAAAFGPGGGARADDGPLEESERRYEGFVPGPIEDPDASLWTKIVDAETGQPIPGARLTWHSEDVNDTAYLRAHVLGSGEADASGIAHCEPIDDEKPSDGHWVVAAEGYAPLSEYGSRPPSLVALRRGETVVLRVLDPFGAPVAGAALEVFEGCSHAPALARATTDAEGLARFGPIEVGSLRLWVESPHGCLDPVDMRTLFGHGSRIPDLVLAPGFVPKGRVVDRLGAPIPGVLVRPVGRTRGPVTLTGADGRYVLPAVPPRSEFWMRPWDFLGDRCSDVDDLDHRGPVEVTLDPYTRVERPFMGATLRVTARPEGAAHEVESVAVVVVREADGVRKEVLLDPAPPPAGEGTYAVELSLAPGRHRVAGHGAFESPFEIAPATVVAVAGETREVALTLTPRPLLQIRGNPPEDAELSLVTASESISLHGMSDGDVYPLAPTVRAAVHVRDALWAVTVVPVGPVHEGRRTADLPSIPMHRILWPKDVKPESVSLLYRGRPQAIVETEAGIATRAAGEVVLEVELGADGFVHRLPLSLPAEEAVELTVDPRSVPAVPAAALAVYQVERPAGATGRLTQGVSVSGGSSWGSTGGRVEASIGARITYSLDGYLTKRFLVTRAEEVDVRWGTASLSLTVVDTDGDPVDARVFLDDEALWAPEGALSIAGLDAGPHRVLIADANSNGPGIELRLLLRDGEKREKRVTFPSLD